ncbi:hypothetical protein P186_2532 [Pyrobaculum ferrireducens]|uniref:Uncharacterized protein n=1 Tax=Pyrobaculum ferrireducens TaxID=1104324 RepID=G7VD39_9CREN|nr:hypothetical protein P186_2532 [Pyrobaculum ferrireducens]
MGEVGLKRGIRRSPARKPDGGRVAEAVVYICDKAEAA